MVALIKDDISTGSSAASRNRQCITPNRLHTMLLRIVARTTPRRSTLTHPYLCPTLIQTTFRAILFLFMTFSFAKMSKRKFEDISRTNATPLGDLSEQTSSQRRQLDGHLDQSKKALLRALKVARGFERQKLGRRQKTAKVDSNDADTTRLEAEVSALKVCRFVLQVARWVP